MNGHVLFLPSNGCDVLNMIGHSANIRFSWVCHKVRREVDLETLLIGSASFTAKSTHTILGCVFRQHVVAWDAHILHDPPSSLLLLWTSRHRSRVCFLQARPSALRLTRYRLLFVLALGVYASSFVKDLVCSPRPYAPPVARLSTSGLLNH